MQKKGIFLGILLSLFFTLSAQAELYQGYELIGTGNISSVEVPTKGTSIEGLRNTLLSQLLTGEIGEEIVLEVPGETIRYADAPGQVLEDYTRKFHVAVKHQDKKDNAHLVMVIPGFGAPLKKGVGPYLSDLLNRNGFVTITSNSPANTQFILESSTNGAPGYQTRDGKDLYLQLELAIQYLEEKKGYSFDKVSVIGASLGSMNALQVLKQDEIHKARGKDHIGLYRVFSLNPPISNVYGSTIIDTFVAKAKNATDKIPLSDRVDALTDAIGSLLLNKFGTKSFDQVAEKSPKALEEMKTQDTTQERLQYLVGFGFAPTVGKAQQAFERRWADELAGTRFSDRDFVIFRFFTDFLKRISIQYSYRPDNNWDLPSSTGPYGSVLSDQGMARALKISENESVESTVLYLQDHDKMTLAGYHLVTWDDDFLLRNSDPDWITNTLTGGENGTGKVFTNGGGHLGGYWQADFQKYLIDNLK